MERIVRMVSAVCIMSFGLVGLSQAQEVFRGHKTYHEIHIAAQKGDSVRIRKLLKSNPNLVNEPSIDGLRPLHWAVSHGQKEAMRLLLAKGADIDSKTNGHAGGETPLHFAVRDGHKAIVDLLLSAGASINQKNGSGSTPLLGAVASGHKEIVQLLLKKGADINVRNLYGLTLLQIAEMNGHKEVAKILRWNGAKE